VCCRSCFPAVRRLFAMMGARREGMASAIGIWNTFTQLEWSDLLVELSGSGTRCRQADGQNPTWSRSRVRPQRLNPIKSTQISSQLSLRVLSFFRCPPSPFPLVPFDSAMAAVTTDAAFGKTMKQQEVVIPDMPVKDLLSAIP
jgi:hypothetical protein